MATPIKAIPTLRGKEAREFRRKADEAERNFKGYENRDLHPFCQLANAILRNACLQSSIIGQRHILQRIIILSKQNSI